LTEESLIEWIEWIEWIASDRVSRMMVQRVCRPKRVGTKNQRLSINVTSSRKVENKKDRISGTGDLGAQTMIEDPAGKVKPSLRSERSSLEAFFPPESKECTQGL